MSSQTVGYIVALAAAVLWGVASPIAMLAYQMGLAPLDVTFWRVALAGLFFLLQSLQSGHNRLPFRQWPKAAAFGLIGIASFYAVYHRAIEEGGVSLALVLLYTAPVHIALAEAIIFDVPMTFRKGAGVGLATIGVGMVALSGSSISFLSPDGLFWGALAGVLYAVYYLGGQRLFPSRPLSSVHPIAFPIGALALFVFATGSGPGRIDVPTETAGYLYVLWLGVGSTFVGFWAHGIALDRLPATSVSVLTSLEPLVGSTIAYFWFEEQLGFVGTMGAIFILIATLLIVTARTPSQQTVLSSRD